jgi:cytochrome c2
MRRAGNFCRIVALAILVLTVLPGNAARAADSKADGDAQRGAVLIGQLGCGACHIIPGVSGAEGLVGPPLDRMGKRVYIAGVLRNTPDNMITWLRNPQSVVPNNAMPNMVIDQQQARDIAAYFYTLDQQPNGLALGNRLNRLTLQC